MDSSEKKHRHHRKHKHKKHKKHRKNRETNETEDTEQEIELDQIEYIPHDIDIIGDEITLTTADDDLSHQPAFILDEHCDGTIEVIEEQLVEIDDAIGTINIEEMVLENYGQEYGEELEVDVGGMDDENGEEALEDGDEDLPEEAESEDDDPEENSDSKTKPKDLAKNKKRDKNKNDGDISSAEEAWLDALESGKLEEMDDELKKIRNPKLMTVRQRALLERKGELQNEETIKEELVALPTGYKETVMTEEALKKKALKSQRRREVAAQKREKEKKRTIDRLLQKRESKNKSTAANTSTCTTSGSSTSGLPASASQVTCYSWRQSADGQCQLVIPPSLEPSFFRAQPPPVAPVQVHCAVDGCSNLKRYSCSRTHVPLCSLNCYRINLQTRDIAV